jgi:hypothetical protein
VRKILAISGIVLLILGGPAGAAEVQSFRLQTRDSFLAGTLDGISVDSLGILQLADRVERLAEIGEPFLLSAAAHPEGWVLGTGNAGRVLLAKRSGELVVLHSAPEPEIFAVWADDDGTVFAGSSPGGKVYRIAGSEVTVFFEPGETYIWGLARAADGELLVATGTEGKLYKVDSEGNGELFYDSKDTHLRVLKVLSDGDTLVGTAGEGLILEIDPQGSARTIYDAAHPEVVSLTTDGEGGCYAAVLASEASLVDLSKVAAPAAPKATQEESGEAQQNETAVSVQVSAGPSAGAAPVGTRPKGFEGPRSEILHISPAGVVESVAQFEEETVYSVLWHRNRLWVGTGLDGKVFSLRDGKPVLEKDVDERQVVVLLPDQPGPAFATTNAAALYRISSETERRGLYTSPALDAGQIARFGGLRWRGELPRGTHLEFSFRSGLSSEPDQTWSEWTASDEGTEISMSKVPSGRYVQWRAELVAADGRSPSLSEVMLSYKQVNLAPKIKSLTVLDPGEILVPANFNPSNQVFEPAHPNRQGIFTTLTPAKPGEEVRLKTLWKRGYRTLRWEADDPNEDELTYQLSFRLARSPGEWLTVVDDLEEEHYSFDATVLPDGVYRFQLRVSDRSPLQAEKALQKEEISEPVLIDHTPPVLTRVTKQGERWQVEIEDALNPLREAVFSVDAGEWQPASVVDGLLDGQRETLILSPSPAGRLVLLRVTDAAFNVVTFDILQEAE